MYSRISSSLTCQQTNWNDLNHTFNHCPSYNCMAWSLKNAGFLTSKGTTFTKAQAWRMVRSLQKWCASIICLSDVSDCTPLKTFPTSCTKRTELELQPTVRAFQKPMQSMNALSMERDKQESVRLEVIDMTDAVLLQEDVGRTVSYPKILALSTRSVGIYLVPWPVGNQVITETFTAIDKQ